MYSGAQDGTQSSDIQSLLERLADGKFQDIPAGSCPLTQLIKTIADKAIASSQDQLTRTVTMSVIANKGVAEVAEMTRQIAAVDNQAQSIAAAVEEMSSSVHAISMSAATATEEASKVADNATNGLDAANKAQTSMHDIALAVQESANKVDALSVASEEIGKIVKDIEDIARQTNLLALNATIEAARAGEAGKGFAVVASEVKNLSHQTSEATVTIRERIEILQAEMAGIIEAMNEGTQKAEAGRAVIDASTREMTSISSQVHVVNDKMQEINGILEQQAEASDEVSKGVGIIARMSSENVISINNVIATLEETEAPIIDGVNKLVAQGGKAATIAAAKSDHMIWMRKLAQMLAGRTSLNPNELADHHGCRLGKWYDQQQDPAFIQLPEWSQLVTPHKDVHHHGIEAARHYASGRLDDAIESVHLAANASQEVMRLLDAIERKLG